MSFQYAAQDIRVDDGHILRARLQNGNGDFVDAELDLNSVIGNENGHFSWGGQGFADSASEISFSVEGDAQVPVLRAQLGDGIRDINLGERIGNNDGQFVFN